MSLLRIHCALRDPPLQCRWALIDDNGRCVEGEGRLAELPRRAQRIHLLLAAADVVLTRVRLPRAARRRAGAVLAFAIEEETVGEPDANQVIRLGATGDADALAVVNRRELTRWRDALAVAGIRAYDVHCETLLLPWQQGEWSLAWNGREGFVRSAEFEGAATDCGDRESPPLSLRLMLEEARARDAAPAAIAVFAGTSGTAHAAALETAPDIEAWQRSLGVTLRFAGPWDWRTAPLHAGTSLMQERRRWRGFGVLFARLRPAAWMLGLALAIHAAAAVTDWTQLTREQRALRQHLEERFRAAVPDAVAVVDPALQMRRKLAEARHAAGLPDGGDFLPMIEKVAAALSDLPAGSVRLVSYENGRLAVELATAPEAAVRRVVARLLEAGLSVDAPVLPARPASTTVVLTVRST